MSPRSRGTCLGDLAGDPLAAFILDPADGPVCVKLVAMVCCFAIFFILYLALLIVVVVVVVVAFAFDFAFAFALGCAFVFSTIASIF